MFVGKDFLKMKAPPNYKVGIIRGDYGFSTTAEKMAESKNSTQINEELDLINSIDQKRNQIKKRRSSQSSIDLQPPPEPKKLDVSLEDWMNLAPSKDLTHRRKRLNQEFNDNKRTYAAPNNLVSAHTLLLAEAAKLRPKYQMLIRNQPFNYIGYLKLAQVEFKLGEIKTAKTLVGKALQKIPHNEELWLEYINFHEKLSDKRSIARKAVSKNEESTKLWLANVELEPTLGLQQQTVQEALMSCPSSKELWQKAIDLEVNDDIKQEMRNTSKEFVQWTEEVPKKHEEKDEARKEQESEDAKSEDAKSEDAKSETKDVISVQVVDNTKADEFTESPEIEEFRKTRDISVLIAAINNCRDPQVKPLLYIEQFENTKAKVRQRGIISKATAEFPKSAELWLKWIQFEKQNGVDYKSILSTGLQNCPHNPYLWVEQLTLTPELKQEALTKTSNHELVLEFKQ